MNSRTEEASQEQIKPMLGSGLVVACSVLLYLFVEFSFISDLRFLAAHQALAEHTREAVAFQLTLVASLVGFFLAWRRRGVIQVGDEKRDVSTLFVSVVVINLLSAVLTHQGIVLAVYKLKQSVTP